MTFYYIDSYRGDTAYEGRRAGLESGEGFQVSAGSGCGPHRESNLAQ